MKSIEIMPVLTNKQVVVIAILIGQLEKSSSDKMKLNILIQAISTCAMYQSNRNKFLPINKKVELAICMS